MNETPDRSDGRLACRMASDRRAARRYGPRRLPMTPQPSCPNPARWNELLTGTLADAEQAVLSEHLETCEACQRTLQGLAAGGPSWAGAARHLGPGQAPDETALRRA